MQIKSKFIDSKMTTDAELASAVSQLQTQINDLLAMRSNIVQSSFTVPSNSQMVVYQELLVQSGDLTLNGEIVIL